MKRGPQLLAAHGLAGEVFEHIAQAYIATTKRPEAERADNDHAAVEHLASAADVLARFRIALDKLLPGGEADALTPLPAEREAAWRDALERVGGVAMVVSQLSERDPRAALLVKDLRALRDASR